MNKNTIAFYPSQLQKFKVQNLRMKVLLKVSVHTERLQQHLMFL